MSSLNRRAFVAGASTFAALALLEGCSSGGASAEATAVPATPYDIGHILITGQSLSRGDQSLPILTMKQPFSNLMFNKSPDGFPGVNAGTLGVEDLAFVPLTATLTNNPTASAYETLGNGFADSVIAATAETREQHPSIRAPLAMLLSGSGGYGAIYSDICGPTDYAADHIHGSPSFQEMMSQVGCAKALADAAGQSYFVPCVFIVHGEFDAYNAVYLQDLIDWQHDIETGIQALTGQTNTIPIVLSQTCPGTLNPGTSPYAQLQAAILYPDRFILAGPEYQIPHWGPGDLSLSIHLPARGQRMLGSMMYRAFRSVFLEGGTWKPLMPTSVVPSGKTVVIDYTVPVPPIVLDTSWCVDPGNFGFAYADNSGATIESVAVTGAAQITLTLTKDSAAAGRYIGYAHRDLDPGFGPLNGTRGCLRDSSSLAGYYDTADAVPPGNYSVRWGDNY